MMSKEERDVLAKEGRRKTVILKDAAELSRITIAALKNRRSQIDHEADDQYEQMLALTLSMQIEVQQAIEAGLSNAILLEEHKVRRLESSLQYENVGEKVRGL